MVNILNSGVKNIYSDLSLTESSNYLCLHNNLMVEALRQDYLVADAVNNSGNYELTLSSSIGTADSLNVGDVIFFSAPNIKEVGKIISTNGTNKLVVSIKWVADYSGGMFINLFNRKNYRVVLQVLGYDFDFSKYFLLANYITKPDLRGNISVQINEALKKISGLENISDYTEFQFKEKHLSNKFNLRIVEGWEGNEEDLDFSMVDDSRAMYFISMSKQLLEKYGENAGEYVPMSGGQVKAKWLGAFKRPTFFSGYPTDVSFIFSDLINNSPITVTQTFGSGSPVTTQLDNAKSFFVNRILCSFTTTTPYVMRMSLAFDDSFTPTGDGYVADYVTDYWD